VTLGSDVRIGLNESAAAIVTLGSDVRIGLNDVRTGLAAIGTGLATIGKLFYAAVLTHAVVSFAAAQRSSASLGDAAAEPIKTSRAQLNERCTRCGKPRPIGFHKW